MLQLKGSGNVKYERMTDAERAEWEAQGADYLYNNEVSDEDGEWHCVREWELSRSDELSRQSFQDAIQSGSMLRVAPIFNEEAQHVGFRVTLREKGNHGMRLELTTYFQEGGLRDRFSGTVIFEQYEFSMHKYVNKFCSRAPMEYVRRKLAKERV